MKLILAFVKPARLEEVERALEDIEGLPGMSVTDVRGFGREKVTDVPQTAAEALTDYTRHVRIEIAARDEQVAGIVETIERAARTGQRGDGKVYVLPVEDALRIRTGEHGDAGV